ncbi:c-type cytochrome [Marinobacter orientalis]|uniref:Cytochrome c4 n=1 Tax=Marinobacter orientalis TaxID=1928859 RepID=A0A7Y0REV2_9GAMM|nr:c-type cytochrome [Marinobacter orientalis]NMT64923.1 cytochrome c4 [Marinobacter orientalis]TGX48180.1 cytochrome c4 [Marinobacter orientalis]
MKKFPGILAALGLVTCSALAEVEGDADRGAAAAGVCTACHQADGSGKNVPGGESWPRLAGLDAAYIAKQLHDYQSGERSNASMMPFANMLDEQQIADVAAYYASLPATQGDGGEDAGEAMLKRGKQLAERGDWSAYIVSCKSCHGPGNRGAGEVFPGIAGQHAGYIKAQLQAWKAGTRKNDPQDLMGSIARRMSDDDIQAVAAWLAGQKAVAN